MAYQNWIRRHLAGMAVVAALTPVALAEPAASKPAATVNGEPISLAEVDAIFKERSIETMHLSAADFSEIRKESLNMLIDELLVKQFLRKNAPPTSSAQVNQQFRDLLGGLKAEGQTLAEYLRVAGQTEAQLRAAILTSLQCHAYLESQLTDARLHACYEANRDVFDRVTVRVSHVMVRRTSAMTPAQREEARNRIVAIRQEIMSGKMSFADAARTYSQDASASRGGDIGEIPRKGAVDEALARTAFALKPNQVSDVVETASGVYLLMVTARKVGSPSTYEAAEARVRELAGDELLCEVLAEQRARANVKIHLDEEHDSRTAQSGLRR